MAAIDGKIRVLKIKRPGEQTFRQVGFLLVNTWQRQTAMLPTTTPNDGGYRTEVPVEKSSTITFSALVYEDVDYVDRLGYKELLEIEGNNELVEWLLIAEGKNLAQSGKGHFVNLNEQAPSDGFVQVNGTLNVFGRDYEFNDTEPPTKPVLTLVVDMITPKFTLTWTTATDNMAVDYYELRKNNSGKTVIIPMGQATEYTDRSVQYFQYYSYNVRAVDVVGNIGPWSNKRLGFARLPSGVPSPPDYMLFENGNTILDEKGIPLIFE